MQMSFNVIHFIKGQQHEIQEMAGAMGVLSFILCDIT